MDVTNTLKTGIAREQSFPVTTEQTAAHLGSGMVKVLATPSMILYMEITARTLLDELLPEGYSSVGTKVNIEHLAPAPLGSEVLAKASILAVSGNRVRMHVTVTLGDVVIGEGEHERYVIEIERFLKRMNK